MVADALTDGVVLGVDVGFSPTSRSTCFCALEWDRSNARLRFCLTTTSPTERRTALDTLVNDRRVVGVALDGPLANGLRLISHYRAAEAILSRGVLQKRGKPGQTSAPVGQKLHAHASELAALIVQQVQVDPATHCDPIARDRIVEAFPNIYLAALVDEVHLLPLSRNASDVYWRSLVGTSNKLVHHVDRLLPGRRLDLDLASISNHDHRAGVICALTALSVALDRHVAVGDALDGDIMLPAEADWGISATTPGKWLEPVLRANLATVRTGRRAHDNHKNARITGLVGMLEPSGPLNPTAILSPFGRSAVRGSTAGVGRLNRRGLKESMDRNPQSPWNPRPPAEITPTEFEELVLAWLRRCGPGESQPMAAEHLGILQGAGGEYKIDVLVKLTVFGGATVDVLVECKHQTRPVEREDAMVLEAKVRDVGAHKGMLFSTSGFQKGAVQYAAARGIATVAVVNGKWLYETRGAGSGPAEPPPWMQVDLYAGIRITPTDAGVSCHTIELARVDALKEWFAEGSAAE